MLWHRNKSNGNMDQVLVEIKHARYLKIQLLHRSSMSPRLTINALKVSNHDTTIKDKGKYENGSIKP